MDNQQEGSLQTLHTGGSGYRRKGHAMHEQGDEKAMQREIDDLKKRLHRAQRKQSPPSSDVSSNDEEDISYRQRSETPPNESFSCEEEHLHKRRRRSPLGSFPMRGGPTLEIGSQSLGLAPHAECCLAAIPPKALSTYSRTKPSKISPEIQVVPGCLLSSRC